MTYVSKSKYGFVCVFYDGKWMKFDPPTIDIRSINHQENVNYDYPSKLHLSSRGQDYRIDYTIEEDGDHFGLDAGMFGVRAPFIISTNYRVSGILYKILDGKETVVKEFNGIKTSIQYYSGADYKAILKTALLGKRWSKKEE